MKRLFNILSILSILSVCMGANVIWDGSESTSWSNGDNWVGDSAPGAGDVAIFDGATSNNNCLVDDFIDILGMEVHDDTGVDTVYTGDIDLGDTETTLDVGSSGVVLDGSGIFDCGDATITITGGPLDYLDQGTWTTATSSIVLKGAGTLTAKSTVGMYQLEVFTSAVTTIPAGAGTYTRVTNSLTVNGTLTVSSGKYIEPYTTATCSVGASGSISGDGNLLFSGSSGGGGLTTFTAGATIDCANVLIAVPLATATFVGATWDCGTLFKVYNNSATARVWDPSGTQTINCNAEFENTDGGGTLSVDGTNNPSYVFTGNVVWDETAGAITWDNAGSGTITFSGTAAQSIDLEGGSETVEAVEVDKSSNTLTLADDLDCASYTQTDGTVDYTTNSVTVTTTGNLTLSAGADGLAAGLPGCTLAVGGDFAAMGTDGDNLLDMTASAGWTLTVTGTGTATSVDVSYSDASGGTEIDATADCTDSGNNENWNFGVGRGVMPLRYFRLRRPPFF